MSTISISNLNPSGLDLFSDSENYLDEISESEFASVNGGITTPVCFSIATRISAASSPRCFQSIIKIADATVNKNTAQKAGEFLAKLF